MGVKLLKQFAENTIFSQNDYLLPLGVVCQKVTSLLFLTSSGKNTQQPNFGYEMAVVTGDVP